MKTKYFEALKQVDSIQSKTCKDKTYWTTDKTVVVVETAV